MSFQKYLLHKKKKQLMTFDMNYEIIVQKNLLAHYVQTSLQTIKDMLVYRNIQPNYLNKYSDIEISTIIDNDDLFVFQVNETTSIIYVLQMDQRTRKQISKITSNMKHVLFVIDDTFKRDTFSSYTADNVEIWNVNGFTSVTGLAVLGLREREDEERRRRRRSFRRSFLLRRRGRLSGCDPFCCHRRSCSDTSPEC